MKKIKICLSLLLALVLIAGTISARRVFATTGTISVETEETEGGVAVKLIAGSAMDFGGIWFSVAFDEATFTFESISSRIGSAVEGTNVYEINSGNKVDFAAGEAIVTINYSASNLETNKEYTFDITIKEAYDDDMDDHVEKNTVISGTFKKAAEESSSSSESSSSAESSSSSESSSSAETSSSAESGSSEESSSAETAASSENSSEAGTEASSTEPSQAVSTEAESTAADSTTAADETTAPATSAAGSADTPASGDDKAMPVFMVTGAAAAILLGVLVVIRRKNAEA